MEDAYKSHSSLTDNNSSKSKKTMLTSSKKKTAEADSSKTKERDKGEKRTKRRKASDSSKKLKKEDFGEGKMTNTSRHSSATPDSDPRVDQSDSPITDDVFEGSNSSIESNEMLSMGSLLKSVLDCKKKLLLESDEIQQFFLDHRIKQELWESPSN